MGREERRAIFVRCEARPTFALSADQSLGAARAAGHAARPSRRAVTARARRARSLSRRAPPWRNRSLLRRSSSKRSLSGAALGAITEVVPGARGRRLGRASACRPQYATSTIAPARFRTSGALRFPHDSDNGGARPLCGACESMPGPTENPAIARQTDPRSYETYTQADAGDHLLVVVTFATGKSMLPAPPPTSTLM